MKFVLLLAATLSLGCVNTTYIAEVQVTKNAQGEVVGTVETEQVIQKNRDGWPYRLKYLQGVDPFGAKLPRLVGCWAWQKECLQEQKERKNQRISPR